MSYNITLTKEHNGIAAGTEGEKVEASGQSMYRFECSNGKFDYATFSWNYIQNHKQYFSIKTNKGE